MSGTFNVGGIPSLFKKITFEGSTGTARINLPDAGTTAADGIAFGSDISLYRSAANSLITNSNNIVLGSGSMGSGVFGFGLNPGGSNTYARIITGTAAAGFSFQDTKQFWIYPINSFSSSTYTAGKVMVMDGATGNVSIGNISPSARLDITGVSLTGSSATSALSISQTWNTTGSPTLIFANVTNIWSGASANLMDLQVGGSSVFKVSKDGQTIVSKGTAAAPSYSFKGATGTGMFLTATNNRFAMSISGVSNVIYSSSGIYATSNSSIGFISNTNTDTGAPDAGIARGGANKIYVGISDFTGTLIAGSIGIGIASPNARAILDATSTTKGFLPPRMTTAQRDAIATVAGDAGLTIFNTTTTKLEVWDGAAWQQAW